MRAGRSSRIQRLKSIQALTYVPRPIHQDQFLYDRQSGEMVEKYVFVAFLQGDSTYNKVRRICDVVGANVYDYDPSNVRNDIEVSSLWFTYAGCRVAKSEHQDSLSFNFDSLQLALRVAAVATGGEGAFQRPG